MKRNSSTGRETHNDTGQQHLDRKTHSVPGTMAHLVRVLDAQAREYEFKYTAPRQKLEMAKCASEDVEK